MKAHREGEQVLSGVVCSDLLISFLSLGEVGLCPQGKENRCKKGVCLSGIQGEDIYLSPQQFRDKKGKGHKRICQDKLAQTSQA